MALDFVLLQLHRHLTRIWSSPECGAGKFGLSISEFDYLYTVAQAEGVDGGDTESHDDSLHLSTLAAEMQVQKSSASVMAKKLESKGLIQRVQCRYDSRAQHILLTESGRTHLEAMQKQVYVRLAEHLKHHLSKKDFQQLDASLERLAQLLDK